MVEPAGLQFAQPLVRRLRHLAGTQLQLAHAVLGQQRAGERASERQRRSWRRAEAGTNKRLAPHTQRVVRLKQHTAVRAGGHIDERAARVLRHPLEDAGVCEEGLRRSELEHPASERART